MINLTDVVAIGNSDSAMRVRYGAILNVAVDFRYMCSWPLVEAAQVGLINGPGNELYGYCSAVLCLKALANRHKNVLVFDHDGALALVVALMYITLQKGQIRPTVNSWSHWPTWEQALKSADDNLGLSVIDVHPAHIEMFNKVPWSVLNVL